MNFDFDSRIVESPKLPLVLPKDEEFIVVFIFSALFWSIWINFSSISPLADIVLSLTCWFLSYF